MDLIKSKEMVEYKESMSKSENTQLTPAEGYDVKTRMIFSEAVAGSVPDSKPKIEFKRINISTTNEDGTEGELVLPTGRLFSFGVSENVSQETGKVTGYTFPLCLWNKDGATHEEKVWTETFTNIVENCIEHLLENREEIEMFELQRSDLVKSKGGLNPLYWKKEKVKDEKTGKTVLRRVPGVGPTLYTKLIYSKKNDKFLTQFFDMEGEKLNAPDLMGKYCHATAAVKIESIFISGTGKISLQVKLYEAVVEPSGGGMKRLLDNRPKSESKVLAAAKSQKTAADVMGGNDATGEEETDGAADDAGSLAGSDNEEAPDSKPAKVAAPKKRVVRRVVAKK